MNNADKSLPPSGQALIRAFERLIDVLHERSIHYAIIGGIAAIQHGRARTTADVDVLLTVPQIGVAALFGSLQDAGFTVELKRNIGELRDHGLTKVHLDHVVVDIMRPILPIYAHVLDRAEPLEVFGKAVRITTVEGLIVMKLIAFRPQDQADIEDLITAHAGQLDVDYVRSEFATIADADDPRWATLETWIASKSIG